MKWNGWNEHWRKKKANNKSRRQSAFFRETETVNGVRFLLLFKSLWIVLLEGIEKISLSRNLNLFFYYWNNDNNAEYTKWNCKKKVHTHTHCIALTYCRVIKRFKSIIIRRRMHCWLWQNNKRIHLIKLHPTTVTASAYFVIWTMLERDEEGKGNFLDLWIEIWKTIQT